VEYSRLLVFGSTHKALKAESALKAGDVNFRLLPSPKEFAEYCALVIGVNDDVFDLAVKTLAHAGLSPKMVLQRKGSVYVKV
jgi:hypothetical protein